MGKVLERELPCPFPDCTSSNAYEITQDDKGKVFGYCYSCSKSKQDPYKESGLTSEKDYYNSSNYRANSNPHNKVSNVDEALLHPIRELVDRGISQATCNRYGVRVGVDTRNGIDPIYHLYPCYRNGTLSGFKQRIVSDKQFKCIGDCNDLDLFGAHLIPRTGKKLFITEGELDALALYQVLKHHSSIDWHPPVVSLPSGASSAVKSISLNLDLINGYDEIILCFDSDSAGSEAATKVCKLLAGKVYVAKFSEKDPNEMLLKGKGLDLKWSVLTNARKYQPDGIITGPDIWTRYVAENKSVCHPYPDILPGLNELIHGAFGGTIVTVAAGTGIGKTQFLRYLKWWFHQTTNEKIADIELEADIEETVDAMLSIHLSKRIADPKVYVSDEERRSAFDAVYGSGRISLYDYFGGMDDDNLFSKLRYFAATGHKFIFLDHISIIVSQFAAAGGERERIDTIMTKLAQFVKETGCIIFLVSHLNNNDGRSFEEGAIPTLNNLRGSGTIKQLSWYVIFLSRNLMHPDPFCKNIVEVTVGKAGRRAGKTGSAGHILFDDNTGRYFQVEAPPNYYQKAQR